MCFLAHVGCRTILTQFGLMYSFNCVYIVYIFISVTNLFVFVRIQDLEEKLKIIE